MHIRESVLGLSVVICVPQLDTASCMGEIVLVSYKRAGFSDPLQPARNQNAILSQCEKTGVAGGAGFL